MKNLINLLGRSFNLLELSDKRRTYFAIPVSILLALLDLAGVILLGSIGTLAFRIVSNDSKPTKVEILIKRIGHLNLDSTHVTIYLALVTLFILGIKTLLQAFYTYWYTSFLSKIESSISKNLIQNIFTSSVSDINEYKYTDYQWAIMVGSNRVVVSIIGAAIGLLTDLVATSSMAILAFYASPLAFCVAILIFIFTYLGINRPINRRARSIGDRATLLYTDIGESLLEAFNGVKELKVYAKEGIIADKINASKNEHSLLNARTVWLNSIIRYVLEIVVLAIGLCITGVLLLTTDSRHAVTVLVIFMAVGFRLIPNIQRIQNAFVSFRIGEGATRSLFQLIEKFEKSHASKTGFSENNLNEINEFQFIRIDNVSYKPQDSNNFSINSVSFDINFHETIAIIGDSGSGKTTLLDLIAGLNSPTIGEISVYIEKTKSFEPIKSVLRAYVSQESALFGKSIYENISIKTKLESQDKLKIERIAEKFKLNTIFDRFSSFSNRVLRADGTNISGGERQRISLARAEYSDPVVYLFDEPTSSLDKENRDMVKNYLQEKRGKTTIVIATHDQDLLDVCDRVLRIDQGKVAFLGPKIDLES